jgi:hypothetical protein
LLKDSDQDVSDAAENTDFELRKTRKQRVSKLQQMEEQSVAREKKLLERFNKEEEERKRRLDEEEENKNEYAFLMLKANGKGKGKGTGKKKDGTKASQTTKNTAGQLIAGATGVKRVKNGVTKR